jgi:Ser-tRNA(Ala) deacylase AlaX
LDRPHQVLEGRRVARSPATLEEVAIGEQVVREGGVESLARAALKDLQQIPEMGIGGVRFTGAAVGGVQPEYGTYSRNTGRCQAIQVSAWSSRSHTLRAARPRATA